MDLRFPLLAARCGWYFRPRRRRGGVGSRNWNLLWAPSARSSCRLVMEPQAAELPGQRGRVADRVPFVTWSSSSGVREVAVRVLGWVRPHIKISLVAPSWHLLLCLPLKHRLPPPASHWLLGQAVIAGRRRPRALGKTHPMARTPTAADAGNSGNDLFFFK